MEVMRIMGLDMYKIVQTERLTRPVDEEGQGGSDVIREFCFRLVESAQMWGEGNAAGWWSKSELIDLAGEFIETWNLPVEATCSLEEAEIRLKKWIDDLPWADDEEEIDLRFNW